MTLTQFCAEAAWAMTKTPRAASRQLHPLFIFGKPVFSYPRSHHSSMATNNGTNALLARSLAPVVWHTHRVDSWIIEVQTRLQKWKMQILTCEKCCSFLGQNVKTMLPANSYMSAATLAACDCPWVAKIARNKNILCSRRSLPPAAPLKKSWNVRPSGRRRKGRFHSPGWTNVKV